MECRTLTSKGYVYCKHHAECRKLKVCLCEVNPHADVQLHKRKKHIKKLPWPRRKHQILQLAQQNTITTTMLMVHIGAAYRPTARWLRKLVQEGVITRKAHHCKNGPAAYTIKEEAQNAKELERPV